jgi:hypothetical protein
MVPKPDGTWRPCGNFWRLNKVTEDERFPLPHVQDFNQHLDGCDVFSKLDLVRSYHQVPMAATDIADALSRSVRAPPGEQTQPPAAVAVVGVHPVARMDYTALAQCQVTRREITAYRTALSALVLEDVPFGTAGLMLLCDTSIGKYRPVVPKEWTRKAFDSVHVLGHADARPTQRAVAKRFVWHGLKRDVRLWCRECHACQSSKVARHTRAPLVTRPPPNRRFGSIHVDIVGPLPISQGFN